MYFAARLTRHSQRWGLSLWRSNPWRSVLERVYACFRRPMTDAKSVVELRYSTTSKRSDSAPFACPLIVSIPKGKYTAVQFVENGKVVKRMEITGK